ncbi:MAG: phosphotransferase system HPr (HPr) family protein [Lysobacterales bacterium]|jgi:phosphotransferase system HPr (HPr) family protein
MAVVQQEFKILGAQGLHARPAALFVQAATRYTSDITLIKDGEEVDGKSIMEILTLGAQKDSVLILRIDGEDADQALIELGQLLTKEE